MTTQTAGSRIGTRQSTSLERGQWVKIGAAAALAAVILVLLAQAAALSVWPEAAAFRPLNSYPRTVAFTVIPALVATALFARLARSGNPAAKFIKIAVIVLLISFVPDYTLPDPNRTLLASTIAAGLHVVAAASITGVLIACYNRAVHQV